MLSVKFPNAWEILSFLGSHNNLVHKELKKSITEAQNCYQGPADVRCSPAPKIQVEDLVLILAKFIHTTHPSKKLSEKFLGPFEVIEKPSSYSYQIKLLAYLRSIHLIFHISQLEPAMSSRIEGHHNPFPPHRSRGGHQIWNHTSARLKTQLSKKKPTPLLCAVGQLWRDG